MPYNNTIKRYLHCWNRPHCLDDPIHCKFR